MWVEPGNAWVKEMRWQHLNKKFQFLAGLSHTSYERTRENTLEYTSGHQFKPELTFNYAPDNTQFFTAYYWHTQEDPLRYATFDRMNETRNCHIITIEDPIEFLHSHKKSIVSQREVYHDTKNYLTALKSALREAPEIILLGEMRDEETVSTALSAAETGHLILSTLHTVGAVNTIDRIVDMFQGHQDQVRSQLSMILEAVISEQLIPTIDGELIPVFEIMQVNPAIRSQIRENKIHQIENTMASNRQNGMVMMDDSIFELYQQNKISKDIAIQYSLHPDRMKSRVQ